MSDGVRVKIPDGLYHRLEEVAKEFELEPSDLCKEAIELYLVADKADLYYGLDGEFTPINLVDETDDVLIEDALTGKVYFLDIPSLVHNEFSRIAKGFNVHYGQLYRQSMELYLKGHEFQKKGGGVYLKEDNKFLHTLLGKIVSLEDLL